MPRSPLRFSPLSATVGSDIRAAKEELSKRFLKPSPAGDRGAILLSTTVTAEPEINLVGVGIGEKITEEGPTGIRCVKFYVRNKVPRTFISPKHALPASAEGVPTDVEEIGLVLPLQKQPAMPNPRQRHRPASPGCSVGFRSPAHPRVRMAGTFGALVRDNDGLYLLSNNHVLADESGV